MEVRVLGPVELVDETSTIRLPGAERTLLAALASRLGERVAVEVLAEALWPHGPPPSARKTLQGKVVRLRRTVGASAIVERDGGYLLDPEVVVVDATRVAATVVESRAAMRTGDSETAVELLAEASAAFHGEPYEGVPEEALPAGEVARLQELRATLVEDRVEAELACGRGQASIGELEAFVQANPYRERAWGLLMRALYQGGRPADALDAYGRARVVLAAELGIEPGPALRDIEQAILTHDRRLLSDASPELLVYSDVPTASASGIDVTLSRRDSSRSCSPSSKTRRGCCSDSARVTTGCSNATERSCETQWPRPAVSKSTHSAQGTCSSSRTRRRPSLPRRRRSDPSAQRSGRLGHPCE